MQAIAEPTFKFAQLSEGAKKNAIAKHSDINVDYDWWKWTYEDAEAIGLKIEGFDDYNIDSKLTESVYDVCQNILKNHGETSDTYQLAMEYVPQFMAARLKGWNPERESQYDYELCDFLFDDHEDDRAERAEEWEREFHNKLVEIYLKHLRNEYDYQTTDQAIIDAIESNGYDFTEEGEVV